MSTGKLALPFATSVMVCVARLLIWLGRGSGVAIRILEGAMAIVHPWT